MQILSRTLRSKPCVRDACDEMFGHVTLVRESRLEQNGSFIGYVLNPGLFLKIDFAVILGYGRVASRKLFLHDTHPSPFVFFCTFFDQPFLTLELSFVACFFM